MIPHGGKLSRLIADNDTMPTRYAWNNTLQPTGSSGNIQAFTKKARTSYTTSDCRSQCAGTHSSRTPVENW